MYSLRIRCVKTFAVNNFTVPLSNKRSDKEKFYSVVLMWSLLFSYITDIALETL